MALVKRCSWPGCQAAFGFMRTQAAPIRAVDLRTGTCSRHGKLVTCGKHGNQDIPCPFCRWEKAESDRAARESHPKTRYAAELRAQGYGDEAAAALAARKFAAEEHQRSLDENRVKQERARAQGQEANALER
jgi:hypothetical protein